MTACIKERTTQHYLGRWHGFVPVGDKEHLLIAVFEKTRRKGDKLDANSFGRLQDNTESVIRIGYVLREDFDQEIVQKGQEKKGSLFGVASAHVAKIRELKADVKTGGPTAQKVRSICVLDLVEQGDVDGHAVMGYADTSAIGVSQKQLGLVRQKIRLDLANTFSQIGRADNHNWPHFMSVTVKRIGSILRAAVRAGRTAAEASSV